jgi:hypothetical protein
MWRSAPLFKERSIMKACLVLSVPVFLLLMVSTAWCHQPRIVEGEDITLVENPEVSQAFYGELKGEPASYQIASEDPFKLYVGILVPDLEGIGKDVSVEITREHAYPEEAAKQEPEEEEIHVVLDGMEHEWTRWYEPFGGDWYWEGPELRSNPSEEELPEGVAVEGGVYTLKVFSPDNEGKYVLAVGEREEFPLGEMVQTLFVLPKLKAEFFERPPWSAYYNLVGLFLLIGIGILVGIIVAIVLITKRALRRSRLKRGRDIGRIPPSRS